MANLIKIPCRHKYFPVGIRVDVVFKYRVFERCTFVVNDDNNIVTPYYPYNHGEITTLRVNPYCPHCKDELTTLFVSMSHTEEGCTRLLGFAQASVEQKLLSQSQGLDEGVKDLGCTFRLCFYRRLVWNYSDEAVTQWVERVSSNEAPTYTPASDEAIDALERITATSTTTRCAICLEELMLKNKGEVGRRLPCKHEFHEDCIRQWLHTSHYCPLCRFELPTSSSSSNNDDIWELHLYHCD